MAENFNNEQGVAPPTAETTDRGFLGFGKKEDDIQKPQVGGATEEEFASDFEEKVHVSEDDHVKEPKHETLLEKFHHDDDNGSSSSSSDEEGDDEEKKKRKQEKREKKGLKDKLLEKLPGQKDEEDAIPTSTEKPHVEEAVYSEPSHTEEDVEKKGFLDKIKGKLPGQTKPVDHHEEVVKTVAEGEGEEKKGIMDRIKEKIPGLGHKAEEEEKKDHEYQK